MPLPLLDFVKNRLNRRKGQWRAISEATEVPYDTLSKIARGANKDPGVMKVEALAGRLERLDADDWLDAVRSVTTEHPFIRAMKCTRVVQLARALGLDTSQLISEAEACQADPARKVPAEWALIIEYESNGVVTRHDLRPDLYPVDDPGPAFAARIAEARP